GATPLIVRPGDFSPGHRGLHRISAIRRNHNLLKSPNSFWNGHSMIRQANSIAACFPDAVIVLLSRCNPIAFGENTKIENLKFDVQVRYLWSLKRPQIRSIVRQFINAGSELDEDNSVEFLVAHFENLNIHRTPHNTLTLLTIIESQVDASPVNRTEMIEKLLHINFSKIQSVPRYSTLPDLKDSLYVIGYFVQQLSEIDSYEFTKEYFVKCAVKYCELQYLDIEVDVLFACLVETNIFSFRNGKYYFHFSYWLYFFIAQRMHQDEKFYKEIMTTASYARYPEVIEYYSGIDRRATNLIETLAYDLSSENREYKKRTKLDVEFDPLEKLSWVPSKEQIDYALEQIGSEVRESKLPIELKDAIADSRFDRQLPYIQNVRSYVTESSLYLCMQKMKAAARALRNSDHADVEIRKNLFKEIMAAIRSEMHVIACLAPIFARTKYLSIEGIGYKLAEEFKRYKDNDDLSIAIMAAIPSNMAYRYLDDIYSHKMAPIFYEYLDKAEVSFERALIALIIVDKKPKGWEMAISKYVASLDRDSFYLFILGNQIRGNYNYGFNNAQDMLRLRELTGEVFSLHGTKAKRPNAKLKKKYSDKILGPTKTRSTTDFNNNSS
ncbi:MAG: hypothetical protein WBO55_20075, partial [Rhizobiaceae bacterium]